MILVDDTNILDNDNTIRTENNNDISASSFAGSYRSCCSGYPPIARALSFFHSTS